MAAVQIGWKTAAQEHGSEVWSAPTLSKHRAQVSDPDPSFVAPCATPSVSRSSHLVSAYPITTFGTILTPTISNNSAGCVKPYTSLFLLVFDGLQHHAAWAPAMPVCAATSHTGRTLLCMVPPATATYSDRHSRLTFDAGTSYL